MNNQMLTLIIDLPENQLLAPIAIQQIANLLMIVVYWILTFFWIVLVAVLISYLIWKPLYKASPDPRRIMYGFLLLAIILLLDSMYWALANTSRVGFLSEEVKNYFYNSWFIISIKGGFLVAALTYWITVVRTFRQIEAKFETLYFTRYADQIADAIGVLNPKGVVLYWNKGAEELYGQKRDRVVGKHIKQFLVPEYLHNQIDKTLKQIKYNRKSERFTSHRLKSDGSEILVDINISPFFHDDGSFGGYFGTMRENSNNVFTVPSINEIFENDNSVTDKNSEEQIFETVIEVYKKEQNQFIKRQKRAIMIAIILLLISCAFAILTLFFDKPQSVYFVFGTVVTILGEILPLSYIIKNRAGSFKEVAIKEILERDLIEDKELFDKVIKVIDDFGQTLINEIPDPGIIAKILNNRIANSSKTDKTE